MIVYHKMTIEICNEERFIRTPLIAFQFFSVFKQDTLSQCTYFDFSLRLLYNPRACTATY